MCAGVLCGVHAKLPPDRGIRNSLVCIVSGMWYSRNLVYQIPGSSIRWTSQQDRIQIYLVYPFVRVADYTPLYMYCCSRLHACHACIVRCCHGRHQSILGSAIWLESIHRRLLHSMCACHVMTDMCGSCHTYVISCHVMLHLILLLFLPCK